MNFKKYSDIVLGAEVIATLIERDSKDQPYSLHHKRSNVTTYYNTQPSVEQVFRDCFIDLTAFEKRVIFDAISHAHVVTH